jgi:CDP-paratose 2-epimerase
LDFYSPYGCSKGTADQYTLDYKRIYGLQTVTIRQSCIYGPRQFGIEDQGWVAWFAIAAMNKSPITIYGDGKQVRDILHVEDLAGAYLAAINHADIVTGHAFNIGGGVSNTVSLLEYLVILEDVMGAKIPRSYSDWRPGDQKIFVSDITKAKNLLNWSPEINVRDGVNELTHWVNTNSSLFK